MQFYISTLSYFISPYSEFRNILSIYCELASCLRFIGKNSEY